MKGCHESRQFLAPLKQLIPGGTDPVKVEGTVPAHLPVNNARPRKSFELRHTACLTKSHFPPSPALPAWEQSDRELRRSLDWLLNRWCQRRALRPLQRLLQVYPGPVWHLYHKMELLETLEQVNDSCGHHLAEDERPIFLGLLESLRS
jgi:hypothetical protein